MAARTQSAWLARLNKTSPKLLRLMARSRDGLYWVPNNELARRAGLSGSYISKLASLDAWDEVPAGTIARYAAACGIDLLKPRTSMYFRNRRSKAYLRTMTASQRRMMARLQGDVLRTLSHGNE
ncbi:MAG: hypothetical protein WC655_04170 [Candidatus Hydrogenedentales bacterium]|jgi:hypothetical protein